MSGLSLIELGTVLLLCGMVLPIVWIKIVTLRNRWLYTDAAIKHGILIACVLGIPGIFLIILASINQIQPVPGWVLIILGAFFLICTFVVPAFWINLTSKLSMELGGLAVCAYAFIIALTLGLLSITLLIIGILLEITRR